MAGGEKRFARPSERTVSTHVSDMSTCKKEKQESLTGSMSAGGILP